MIWKSLKTKWKLHKLKLRNSELRSQKKLKPLLKIARKNRIEIFYSKNSGDLVFLGINRGAYKIVPSLLFRFCLYQNWQGTICFFENNRPEIYLYNEKPSFKYIMPLLVAHELGHCSDNPGAVFENRKDEELTAWVVARMLLGPKTLKGYSAKTWYESYGGPQDTRVGLSRVFIEARKRYKTLTGKEFRYGA